MVICIAISRIALVTSICAVFLFLFLPTSFPSDGPSQECGGRMRGDDMRVFRVPLFFNLHLHLGIPLHVISNISLGFLVASTKMRRHKDSHEGPRPILNQKPGASITTIIPPRGGGTARNEIH